MQEVSAYAPGRVELLGNHTDYNEGYVLSAAIDKGITMRGGPTEGSRISIKDETFNVSLETTIPKFRRSETEMWTNYPLGVVHSLIRDGYEIDGFWAAFSSTLPQGAGLSSSAALEVATATLLKKIFNLQIAPMRLAKLCRRAENDFVGVNCGLLDQVSSTFGRKNHAIFLDCRQETVQTIPFPDDVELMITHSGVKHALVGGEYNERRAQCFQAAESLGAGALRDVSMEQLLAGKEKVDPIAFKRALHIVGENERVLRGIEFLKGAHVAEFGALMFDSHESSRVNFENSTPELDALVAIAREEPGVLGSRLTGGGFGGATVSLIRREASQTIQASVAEKYKARTGNTCQIHICEIADGAH